MTGFWPGLDTLSSATLHVIQCKKSFVNLAQHSKFAWVQFFYVHACAHLLVSDN